MIVLCCSSACVFPLFQLRNCLDWNVVPGLWNRCLNIVAILDKPNQGSTQRPVDCARHLTGSHGTSVCAQTSRVYIRSSKRHLAGSKSTNSILRAPPMIAQWLQQTLREAKISTLRYWAGVNAMDRESAWVKLSNSSAIYRCRLNWKKPCIALHTALSYTMRTALVRRIHEELALTISIFSVLGDGDR